MEEDKTERKLIMKFSDIDFSAISRMMDSMSDEEKASRKKFDDLLISNGGIALNTAAADANGDEYWTSTEQTSENVVYGSAFRFGKAYASGGGDKMTKTNSTRRYVRCMKSVQTTDAAIND